MASFKTSLARLSTGFGLVAVLAVGAVVPAFAAGETGVTVTGGGLSGGVPTFTIFGGVTLDGTQKTTTATWAITDIVDARGTGVGWHSSLTLAQFKEYESGAYVTDGKTLATSSVKVTTAPTVAKADASSSDHGVIAAVSTTTALDTGSAVKLVTAEADEGMGSYEIGSMVSTMTIPASAYAKTYKSDATLSLNATP